MHYYNKGLLQKWGLYSVEQIISVICAFVILYMKANFLDKESFVTLAALYYLINILNVILTCGIYITLTTKDFIEEKTAKGKDRIISTLFYSQIIIGLILSFILFGIFRLQFLSNILNKNNSRYIMAVCLIAFLKSSHSLPRELLKYYQRAFLYIAISVTAAISTLIALSIVFYQFRPNITNILQIELSIAILCSIAYTISIRKHLRMAFIPGILKKSLKYGALTIPLNFTLAVITDIDIFLAKLWLPANISAPYVFTVRLSSICRHMINGFLNVWRFYSARIYALGKRHFHHIENTLPRVFVVFLFLFLSIAWFSKEMAIIMGKEKYLISGWFTVLVFMRYIPYFIFQAMKFIGFYNKRFSAMLAITLTILVSTYFIDKLLFTFLSYQGLTIGVILFLSLIDTIYYFFFTKHAHIEFNWNIIIIPVALIILLQILILSTAQISFINLIARISLVPIIGAIIYNYLWTRK